MLRKQFILRRLEVAPFLCRKLQAYITSFFTFSSQRAVEKLHVVFLIIMRKWLKVMLIERVESIANFVVIVFPLGASCGFSVVDYSLLAIEGMIGEVLVPPS